MPAPREVPELEERLEEHVDAVLSSRRTARQPAERLARRSREEQDFVLRWVGAVARSNSEMGYQVANLAPDALEALDRDGVEAWILAAMDGFDREGLRAGIARLQALDQFAAERRAAERALPLDRVRGVLEGFVHGLNGRPLKIEAGETVRTDTGTLFLPAAENRGADADRNFQLYKATVAHLWAQCWYGTWRDLRAEDWEELPDAADRARLHRLETLRLDACLARDLPGIARLQGALRERLGNPEPAGRWREAADRLASPAATARDSLDWARRLRDEPLLAPCCYQGTLDPEAVVAAAAARQAQEKEELRQGLGRLREEAETGAERKSGTFRAVPDPDPAPGEAPVALLLDERPVEPPAEVARLLVSVHQDFGDIPPDHLVPAGPGEYDAKASGRAADDVWKGTYHEEGARHYPEWDHARGNYRKRWCVLREREVHPKFDSFPEATLRKHYGLAQSLCRTFEMIRGGRSLHRGEPHGDEVDLDALVRALSEARAGRELSQRVFVRQARDERSIAVLFMVDMSGSTKGWVNDLEREALILLCEALQRLQDRYAIYGFSGITRKRCELFGIKRFDEDYDAAVAARISGILPQDYTRMGVAIRHLSGLLGQVEARRKLLIALSDGRPEDYTDYRGEYGIEDTRQALIEARRGGIHPFCITIDDTAREYLPRMYGPAGYTVVSDVRRLPQQVTDIYRRLTT